MGEETKAKREPSRGQVCAEFLKGLAKDGFISGDGGNYTVTLLNKNNNDSEIVLLSELNPADYAVNAVDSVLGDADKVRWENKLKRILSGMTPEQKADFLAKLSE